MEKVIDELRAAYDARQTETLRLDEYLDTGDPKPGASAPVTLKDIETLYTASQALKPYLHPHPTLPDVYTLQWEGRESLVTFNRAVFDERPDTVRLLTYGDALFETLLRAVPPPDKSPEERRGFLRLSANGEFPARAILALAHNQPAPVSRIGNIQNGPGAAENAEWPGEAVSQATITLKQQIEGIIQRLQRVEEERQRAERKALEENGRQLLLHAALIEVALGQRPGMFGETLPWEFTEGAITGLRRHRYPFAPLLTLVDVSDLRPSRTDPYYQQLQNLRAEQLRRMFAEVKGEAQRLVKQLAPGPASQGTEAGGQVRVEVAASFLAGPG